MQLLKSVSDVMVYVVFETGDTLTVYTLAGWPVTVTGTDPSVYVNVKGATPVKVIVSVVEPPLHISALPLMIPVGFGK